MLFIPNHYCVINLQAAGTTFPRTQDTHCLTVTHDADESQKIREGSRERPWSDIKVTSVQSGASNRLQTSINAFFLYPCQTKSNCVCLFFFKKSLPDEKHKMIFFRMRRRVAKTCQISRCSPRCEGKGQPIINCHLSCSGAKKSLSEANKVHNQLTGEMRKYDKCSQVTRRTRLWSKDKQDSLSLSFV